MDISCSNCGRLLRIGDEHAGKKARCPHCGNIFDAVPPVPVSNSFPAPSLEPIPQLQPNAASETTVQWQMRTEDGHVYGPVSRSELDQWAQEGRVPASSELNVVGSSSWRRASEVYPWLGQGSANPFATAATTGANPYTSPMTEGSYRTFQKAHRGGVILTLGILGLVCCQCLGPVAWIMAHGDLQEIRAGRMDPAGQGQTQAGMVLGIISTALMVLYVGLQAVLVLVGMMS